MYSLTDFGRMIADPFRTGAYVAALEAAIDPGCTVVDIGAGSGFMALKAAQLGAARVYAIEPNPAIRLATPMAERMGFGDRLQVFEEISTNVDLPEQVDVMVSDIRGNIPLYGGHLPAIVDARTRFLKPDGLQIPVRDRLFAALTRVPELAAAWDTFRLMTYGLDMTAANDYQSSDVSAVHLAADDLASSPIEWHTLEYTTLRDPNVRGKLRWEIERSQTAQAVAVWYDAELLPGIGYSNAPTAPGTVYRSSIFPFPHDVELHTDNTVEVDIAAHLHGGAYLWTWNTRVAPASGGTATEFRQSASSGVPRSTDQLMRRSASYAGDLSLQGEIDRRILNLLHEGRPLGEVAAEVRAQHPDRYSTDEDALGHVADLAERYRPRGNRR